MDRTAETGGRPCPDDDTLSQFLQGSLGTEDQTAIDDHVARCPPCEGRLQRAAGAGDSLPVLRSLADRAGSPDDRAAASALAGTGLELRSVLGAGGMGVVYLVFDTSLSRELALKTIAPRFAEAAWVRARFADEMLITAQLQHPGIVPVHARGLLADGRPYYLMRIIQGHDLGTHLADPAGAEARRPRFLQLFAAVCHAVGYAHSRGFVHRDLKPQNILVGEFGEVQVADWGLARRADPPGRTPDDGVVGTPAYMPPEQADGREPVGYTADVFALGSILTEILTGSPVYAVRGADEVRAAARAGDTGDAIRRLRAAAVPDELRELCVRCVDPDPQRRPATASEVADAVTAYLGAAERRAQQAETDQKLAHMRAAEQRKLRRTTQVAALGVIAVLIAGVVGTAVGLFRAKGSAAQAKDAAAQATAARTTAEANARESNTVLTFVEGRILGAGEFTNGKGFPGGDARLSVLLLRAIPDIAPQFKAHPAAEARIRHSAGRSFLNLGDHASAAPQFERAAELFEHLYGPDDSRTLQSRGSGAVCRYTLGDKAARATLEQTYSTLERVHGPDHDQTWRTGLALASVVLGEGDAERARQLATLVLERRTARLGEDHESTLDTLTFLGMLHRRGRRHQDSLAVHEQLHRTCLKSFGPDDPQTLNARHLVGVNYAMLGREAEGIEWCRETIRLREKRSGPTHFDTLRCYTLLVGLLEQAHRDADLKTFLAGLPDFADVEPGTQPELTVPIFRTLAEGARRVGLPEKAKTFDAAAARFEAAAKKNPK